MLLLWYTSLFDVMGMEVQCFDEAVCTMQKTRNCQLLFQISPRYWLKCFYLGFISTNYVVHVMEVFTLVQKIRVLQCRMCIDAVVNSGTWHTLWLSVGYPGLKLVNHCNNMTTSRCSKYAPHTHTYINVYTHWLWHAHVLDKYEK